MANFELLTLDGLTITGDPTGTLVLEQISDPPPAARPEWITNSDSENALLMRDPRHENAEMTLRVRVGQQTTMDLALDQIGALRDKLAKASRVTDGVALTWTPAGSTRTWTADVLMGEITDLPKTWSGDDTGWFSRQPALTVKLTRKPYWRGAEYLTSTVSSATPIVTLEVANVPGDIPALGRLIVTDAATQNRRHVEWGLEGPLTYNSGTSLLIDSDSLTVTGFAGTQTTQTGAYDPNAAGTNVISATPTFGAVAMAGTGNQSHVGTFKVKARMWTPVLSTTAGVQITGQVRLSWAPGAQPLTANPWTSPTLGGRWEELDLGYITIPAATVGSQRWMGQVEIQGFVDPATGAAGTAYLDYLVLVPVSDGYGVARAQYTYTPGIVVARDDFTATTGGNPLNARVAPLGGTWATSGDATDLAFVDLFGGEGLFRQTTADTAGRYAILGATNYTDVEVSALVMVTTSSLSATHSVIARWTDANNHVRFSLSGSGMSIDQVVAGTTTRLGVDFGFRQNELTVYGMRLTVYSSGRVIGTITNAAGAIWAGIDTESSALATGGTLATGKPGLRDWNNGATTVLRYYDVFSVSTPAPEPPAIYSGRSLQFRYDDTIRQDSTGTYYGRPPGYRGSRVTFPPGTSRVLVKARRNDVAAQADSTVTDSTTIQAAIQPRSLIVPRS